MRFIATLSILVLLTLHAGAIAQTIEDTPENRAAQATRYLEASPISDMIDDMLDNMARTMPDYDIAELRRWFTEYFPVEELETFTHENLVKHFTAEELSALADFYGSPVGKSAMSKFGAYMADVMPFIQEKMMLMMQEAMSESG
jgi:hypothetical protein